MNAQDEDQVGPKRARVDTGTESAKQIAERVYTDAFLSELQQRFGIGPLPAEAVSRLRKIPVRYILFHPLENQADRLKGDRPKYIELGKATERYLALLNLCDEGDIGSIMKVTAQQLGWPEPETNDSDGYYRQLVLLLELLDTAAIRHAGYLAPRGGRPKNLGLEDLTRLGADFWVGELGRRFTVDYHQGAGLTSAFDFIKALASPLDDISDKQIITAMRAEIARRRSPGPRKTRRRLTRT